jgi:uncharacterized membrane protein
MCIYIHFTGVKADYIEHMENLRSIRINNEIERNEILTRIAEGPKVVDHEEINAPIEIEKNDNSVDDIEDIEEEDEYFMKEYRNKRLQGIITYVHKICCTFISSLELKRELFSNTDTFGAVKEIDNDSFLVEVI